MCYIKFWWQVVDAIYDCKSEVIGPGFFRFKAEIGDFPFLVFFIHDVVEMCMFII